MIFKTVTSFAALLLAANEAHAFDIGENNYYEIGTLAERGPCPGFNTLANHGYINRNGKDITLTSLTDAVHKVYGASKPFGEKLMEALVAKIKTHKINGEVAFNLHDLHDHNKLEHDASIGRMDHHFAKTEEDFGFQSSLLEELMEIVGDDEYVTREHVIKHVNKRIQHSRLNNPNAVLDRSKLKGIALDIFILFGPSSDTVEFDKISKKDLTTFLSEERLPTSYTKNWIERSLEQADAGLSQEELSEIRGGFKPEKKILISIVLAIAPSIFVPTEFIRFKNAIENFFSSDSAE